MTSPNFFINYEDLFTILSQDDAWLLRSYPKCPQARSALGEEPWLLKVPGSLRTFSISLIPSSATRWPRVGLEIFEYFEYNFRSGLPMSWSQFLARTRSTGTSCWRTPRTPPPPGSCATCRPGRAARAPTGSVWSWRWTVRRSLTASLSATTGAILL